MGENGVEGGEGEGRGGGEKRMNEGREGREGIHEYFVVIVVVVVVLLLLLLLFCCFWVRVVVFFWVELERFEKKSTNHPRFKAIHLYAKHI